MCPWPSLSSQAINYLQTIGQTKQVTLSDQQVWVKSKSNTYWQGGVINALDRPQWAGSPLRCSQILSSYNSNFHPSFPHNDKKKKDFICTCEWLMLWLQGCRESHILGNTRRDFEESPINYSWPKIIKQKYIKRTWQRYKIKHCGSSLNHIDTVNHVYLHKNL